MHRIAQGLLILALIVGFAPAAAWADPAAVAAARKQRATQRLAELKNDPNITAEALTQAGKEQYSNDAVMKKMEADALAADPKIAEAKTKLTDAGKAIVDLKKKLEENELADPD